MKILASTEGLSEEQWLALRKRGIGGSDAAVAMGASKWKSPMELYLEKIGELDPQPATSEAVYWGKTLEGAVANRFAELNPDVEVRPVNAMLVHPEHTFMIANLDREIVTQGGNGVLEVKTANVRQREQWEDDGVPTSYTMQVQHYLSVTGYQFAWIACLLGGQELVTRYIERDDELIEQMIRGESDFWKCVVDRTPPVWDGSEAAWTVLRGLYPASEPGKKVILPTELQGNLSEYVELEKRCKDYQAIVKDITRAMDAQKQLLLDAMGDAEVGVLGGYQINYKTVERKEYVSKATQYRKFSLKEVA